MDRRRFLSGAAAAALLPTAVRAAEGTFPVTYTTAEWRERLPRAAYLVMREEDTEPPFSSPLNKVEEAGMFHCRGCDQSLYPSRTKFDSGTGWPSFWAPVSEAAIGTREDRKLWMVRTEVHCSRCGSHMGHVFDDGPAPTGKRHCINGVSLVFRPEGGGEPMVG